MQQDERGLALTTDSPEAAAAFNAAIRDYLEYRLSAGEKLKQALAADPGFVMGQTLRGYFMLLIGSNATLPAARKAQDQAKAGLATITPREAMHVAALEFWVAGDTAGACAVWEEVLAAWPTDVLALRLHHFASFWLGRSAALRDLPAGVLPAWGSDMPGYGNVLGMLAFGLEECGEYADAEKTGRLAVEMNPEDLWSVHAVAHVLEMQGRLKDGADWLAQPAGSWTDRNPFKDHIWWHTALFPLEAGDYDRVLALYDAEVKVDENGFYLDVQNAASLLLRLEFCGVDVGDRWSLLGTVAEKRIDDHVLAFTDTHFMIALAKAGRMEPARQLLASLQDFGATPGNNSAALVAGPLTAPISEAILAFAEKRFERTLDLLLPLRHDWQAVGASHAQRDLFHQIVIEAAIGARRVPLAKL
ncbi:MAG: tetratricopeptide repeat protein, partial [Alphaproteobacteria bacterium]|nr:tetratricopeptide repeat protein [Alphaproteobacteria bacterium]